MTTTTLRREAIDTQDKATATKYLSRIAPHDAEWYADTDIARLVQAGDCYGMGPKHVSGFPRLLANFNLPADVSAILSLAQRLDLRWGHNLNSRVRKLNQRAGQGDGQDNEWDEPTTTRPRPAKAEKPAKVTKAPVTKDSFGSREGSGSYNLNATVLEGGATTASEMSEKSGVTLSRAKAHVKWLLERDLIVGDADGFEINGDVAPKTKRPRKSRVVYAIWDINCCSILRWMGQEGWEFDSAAVAVDTLGCRGMSDATMKLHLAAGRKGDLRWGEPAKLTTNQKRQLATAAE